MKIITTLIVAALTIGTALGQVLLPDTAFTLTLTYSVAGTTHTVQTDIKETLNNEHLAVGMNFLSVEGGRRLMASIHAKQNIELQAFTLTNQQQYAEGTTAFVNGFQCWTESTEYTAEDKLKPLRPVAKGIAKYYGDYTFYDYKKAKGVLHGWTYAYLNLPKQGIHLMGSLDEATGYTYMEYNLPDGGMILGKDCAGKTLQPGDNYMAMDVYEAIGDEQEVFNFYETLSRQATEKLTKDKGIGHVVPKAPNRMGWTSWYHYFHSITERIILDNLQAFKNRGIPLDMFQIDDGYQKSVGEWTVANEKFPNGMQPIADSIHAAGYKAGIWLAPYIVEKKSAVAINHPDWLIRDDKGKPISAGLNPGWSGAYYGLDIYNPDVQTYLKNTLDTLFNVWGYDMIKVDFLFAAAMSPPPGKTRGEVMTDAMLLLREWSGDKLILGCGVPLGPVFHLVDYSRVSSDIHMKWELKLLKFLHARERLSSWNATTTSIGRRQLGGRFIGNDPDVFVLRSEKNKLKPAQKHSMFLVNNLFGNLVLHSDNIANYDAEQMDMYLSGFPYREKVIMDVQKNEDFYQVAFRIENREYVALINLAKGKHQVDLGNNTYFDGQTGTLLTGQVNIGSFESRCFYKVTGKDGFELLGGSGYLFPGAEVKTMELMDDKNIRLQYHDGVVMPGETYIRVPADIDLQQVNGSPAEALETAGYKIVVYRP